MVTIPKLKCNRCNHKWTPNVENPSRCPKCKSQYWNKARVRKTKKAK